MLIYQRVKTIPFNGPDLPSGTEPASLSAPKVSWQRAARAPRTSCTRDDKKLELNYGILREI